MLFFDMRIRWAESSDFGPNSDDLGHRILVSDIIPSDFEFIRKPIQFSDRKEKIWSSQSDCIRISPILTSQCGTSGLMSHRIYRCVREASGTGVNFVPIPVPILVQTFIPVPEVPVLMSYRTYQSVRYRYWCCTEVTEVSGTGIDVVPNLPECLVPVLMLYRNYWSIWYGIDVVPNTPRCPVPVWKSGPVPAVPVSISYRSYRSVRYRYWCRTEVTEVSVTGIEVVSNLPKRPAPVISAVYTGGTPWSVPYRTHPCYNGRKSSVVCGRGLLHLERHHKDVPGTKYHAYHTRYVDK